MKVLRALSFYIKNVWLVCGITILIIVSVEIASRILVFIRTQISSVDADPRIHADAFGNSDWGTAYIKELNSLPDLKWHPYVYWRRAPYKGQYTNIDEHGLRYTWNNGSAANGLRIFMFGGSTLWGTGAQDDATIPSNIARFLTTEHGIITEVTNFGASGYVTTQEVIALLRELQRGNIPDVVVFYDGANDTFSTFQNRGIAGLPQNEANREREFNLLRSYSAPRLYQEALRMALLNSATHQVLRSLIRRTTGHDLPDADTRPPTNLPSAAQVGTVVSRTYAWNTNFVRRIGDAYGFKTLFYWQPVIFNKEARTRYEREVYNDIRGLESFYHESTVRTKAHLKDFQGFYDISDVFKGVPRPYFIDPWHITGPGNELVARRMMQDIGPISRQLMAKKQARNMLSSPRHATAHLKFKPMSKLRD